MPKKVLVTGAAGQLGRAIRVELGTALELLLTDVAGSDSAIIPCDITDAGAVHRLVHDSHPDVIVNCAAYTDVDGNERNPELAEAVNVRGVQHLLDACKSLNPHFIQISTDYVFDGRSGPYLESDATGPLSVYGKTKLAAEQLVLNFDTGLVIRTNVLFGPDLTAKASFIRWVVESLRQGKTITVVDDQVNNPTLTDHFARAIGLAIQSGAAGLMHYGGLEFLNRLQFARQIADHFNLNKALIAPISTADLGLAAPRPLESGLVCSRMKMEIGVENFTVTEAFNAAYPNDSM